MADHRAKKRRQSRGSRDAEIRRAAAEWYLVAKSYIDQLYHMNYRMVRRLESEPENPLHKVFDLDDLKALGRGLEDASCRIADIVPIVGEPLPDPLAALG